MNTIDEIFKNATQKIIDKKHAMAASYGSNLTVRLEKEPTNPRDFASEESVMLCLHVRNTLGKEELEHQVQDYNRHLYGKSWEWVHVDSCEGYESESAAKQAGEVYTESVTDLPKQDVYVDSMAAAKDAIASCKYSNVFVNAEILLDNKVESILSIVSPDVYVELWTAEDIANNSEITLEQAYVVIEELQSGDGCVDYSHIQDVVDALFESKEEILYDSVNS